MVAADGAIFRGSLATTFATTPRRYRPEVQSAALAAGLQNTLDRLPEGLRSELGERGLVSR